MLLSLLVSSCLSITICLCELWWEEWDEGIPNTLPSQSSSFEELLCINLSKLNFLSSGISPSTWYKHDHEIKHDHEMVYIQCDQYKHAFDPHLRKMRIVGHLLQHRKPVINMEPSKSARNNVGTTWKTQIICLQKRKVS